jgi:hypothetical protein
MGASRPVQERGCLALTLNAAINSSGSLTGARNQPLTCWRAATLQERRVVGLRQRVIRRKGDEHADAALPLGLLRRCRERPRRRAAEQRDELAPFHSITSSAVVAPGGLTDQPPALATAAPCPNHFGVGSGFIDDQDRPDRLSTSGVLPSTTRSTARSSW